jgi:hypothetical protein
MRTAHLWVHSLYIAHKRQRSRKQKNIFRHTQRALSSQKNRIDRNIFLPGISGEIQFITQEGLNKWHTREENSSIIRMCMIIYHLCSVRSWVLLSVLSICLFINPSFSSKSSCPHCVPTSLTQNYNLTLQPTFLYLLVTRAFTMSQIHLISEEKLTSMVYCPSKGGRS